MATSGYKGYREIMVGQSLPSNEFTPKRGTINFGGLASSLCHTIYLSVGENHGINILIPRQIASLQSSKQSFQSCP